MLTFELNQQFGRANNPNFRLYDELVRVQRYQKRWRAKAVISEEEQ